MTQAGGALLDAEPLGTLPTVASTPVIQHVNAPRGAELGTRMALGKLAAHVRGS